MLSSRSCSSSRSGACLVIGAEALAVRSKPAYDLLGTVAADGGKAMERR